MTNPNDPWQQPPGGQPPQYPQQGPQQGQPYPQQQFPQQQYPGGAMPPPSDRYVPPSQQRPNSVELSFKLWMANIVIGVIGAILTFVLLDDLIEQVAGEVGVSAEAAKEAARPTVTFGIVLGLALLAALAAVAFQMRNGKNWARITLTVLGVLGLIFSLASVGDQFAIEGLGMVVGVLGIVRLLLALAAIVLMYTKEANPFFANRQIQ